VDEEGRGENEVMKQVTPLLALQPML
jgi:hypothetical protein